MPLGHPSAPASLFGPISAEWRCCSLKTEPVPFYYLSENVGSVVALAARLARSALAQRKPRWTRLKSIHFLANLVFSIYALTALVFVILTYLRTLPSASVVLAANRTELIDQQWSQHLGAQRRLTVQGTLGCCGYFSLFVQATCPARHLLPRPSSSTLPPHPPPSLPPLSTLIPFAPPVLLPHPPSSLSPPSFPSLSSSVGVENPRERESDTSQISTSCYARSALPGRRAAFLAFQEKTLVRWYTIVFGLVPDIDQYGPDATAHLLAPHTNASNTTSGYSPAANLLSHSPSPSPYPPYAGGNNSPYASGPAISSEDLATMPYERHGKTTSGGGGRVWFWWA
ncbi:hypothetical protein C8R45DRAFT_1208839 [Mycena sanguinolenta]|nr:hypothetical protein C8R45DRAFT_1208839 [Mycena sanguinolenta]